jgi:glycosyltransferase involved in cell wall biosynthesis
VDIVPAHNEGAGLLPTIEDIKAQLHLGDRLLVVPDYCTDDTATIAAAAGAEVVERRDVKKLARDTLDLASAATPLFCPSARVTSHFPSPVEGAASQRNRWEQGHFGMTTAAPGLLWTALSHVTIWAPRAHTEHGGAAAVRSGHHGNRDVVDRDFGFCL